jgi:hypothetical protein
LTASPLSVFALLACVSGLGVAYRLYSTRSQRGRRAVRTLYASQGALIWMRNAVSLVPLLAPATLLLGLGSLLPRSFGELLSAPALALVGLSLALSYRVPPPFLPTWLRDEIDRGVTQVSRPTSQDWMVFWLLIPLLIVLGPLALLFLSLS